MAGRQGCHPERVPAGWPGSHQSPNNQHLTHNLGRRGYHARRPFTTFPMPSLDYARRFIAQDWTADGTDIRVGTNGRHIAHTGPHHTPLNEYPAGLAKEDEAHARFIAAGPAIYRAAMAVLNTAEESNAKALANALDALQLETDKATT